MDYIDVRSDTVTKPTEEMRMAMYNAKVGDDVLGDDPTVLELQEMGAKLFGKEAGLFTASGSMSNEVAVLTLTNKGEQVVCHDKSHIYNLEVGGLAQLCGVQPRPIKAVNGVFDLEELEANIIAPSIQNPPTTLICMENTFDLNQGLIVSKEHIDAVCEIAHKHNIPVYMDGARILNAAVAAGIEPSVMCENIDMVSLCLSKALRCPIGSLLMGKKEDIARAKVMRQMLGGGWRQAGVVAAAGIVGLSHYKDLAYDHQKAKDLTKKLQSIGLGIDDAQVQTNVIRINTEPVGLTAKEFVEKMDEQGIKVKPVGAYHVRMIMHGDVSFEQLDVIYDAAKKAVSK